MFRIILRKAILFVGVDKDAERMEIFELENHPYYVAVQFHPEYLSRPMAPSPPFVGLILASKDKLKSYLARGCKLSPREHSDYDDTGSLFANISDGSRHCYVLFMFFFNDILFFFNLRWLL